MPDAFIHALRGVDWLGGGSDRWRPQLRLLVDSFAQDVDRLVSESSSYRLCPPLDTLPRDKTVSLTAELADTLFNHYARIRLCVFSEGCSDTVKAWLGSDGTKTAFLQLQPKEFRCADFIVRKSEIKEGWSHVGLALGPDTLVSGQVYLTPSESSYVVQMIVPCDDDRLRPRAYCKFLYLVDNSGSMKGIDHQSLVRYLYD